MGIYVEARIRGDLEELWRRTQSPDLHARWDLRFSSIEYLPRPDASRPQRFLYRTRLGFGLAIDGEGETIGERDGPRGERTSSLRFWSNDPKSLIRAGAGYWKYIPTADGARFVTGYDYGVRFGRAGWIFDRLVFRPLMGWATAWSFDCLRLWLEEGIDPALSLHRSVAHALTRLGIAAVWLYQGLVPKLLARHADELAMLVDCGIAPTAAPRVLQLIGGCEVAFGLILLLSFRSRWPLALTAVLMIAATLAVAVNSPAQLAAAFNPVSLNLSVFVLAVVALLANKHLPSARRCRRKKGERS